MRFFRIGRLVAGKAHVVTLRDQFPRMGIVTTLAGDPPVVHLALHERSIDEILVVYLPVRMKIFRTRDFRYEVVHQLTRKHGILFQPGLAGVAGHAGIEGSEGIVLQAADK